MAIHPSGLFDHRAVLRRDQAGVWRGAAEPDRQTAWAGVGLVGDAPDIQLADGRLTLVRTQMAGRASVSISVGGVFEAVLQDDDQVHVKRHATGDLAATLSRSGRILIAIGAVQTMLGDADVTLETDPRLAEQSFPGLARIVAEPGTKVIWLDPADSQIDAQIAALDHIPPDVSHVLFVVRSNDMTQTVALNRRVMGGGLPSYGKSFAHVSERFENCADWLDYIQKLPRRWPTDPFLRFVIGDHRYELKEREFAYHDGLFLYLDSAGREGLPGRLTQLGVAREASALTAENFVASVRAIVGAPGRLSGA